MFYLQRTKKFICKVLTCFLPYKHRIFYRDALYWFTFSDYIRFKRANYHIVSLGSNCLPRGLTTAIKLKPRRFYGEKSCPFDLSTNTDLNKIAHFIKTDFSDYFDNILININTFPHDYEFSYEVFYKRYKNRIQNFQEIMQSEKIIYFIHSNYTQVPQREDIFNLYEVLKTKRHDKPFKLIILTSEYIEGLQDIIQIPYNLKIDDGGWLVYMINEYGKYNNKYTKYCEWMKKALFEEVGKNYIAD